MARYISETSHDADVEEYAGDPTLRNDGILKKPVATADALDIALGESSNVEYTIESDNSPYLEVRANVPNTDDPTLPVNTFRMWFLGVVFTLVGTQETCNRIKTLTFFKAWHRRQSVLFYAVSQCDNYFVGGAAS